MSDKSIKPPENKYLTKEHHFHFTLDKKYAVIIVLIAIVGMLGFLKIFFFHTVSTPPLLSSTKMKLYTDANNNFSIEIPENWETTNTTSQGTTGINTGHPITQQIETSQMYLPGKIGVTIQIYSGKPACPLNQPITTHLANLPASYDATQHAWTFFTTNSTVVITIAYPGSGGFMEDTTTPSPQEVNQDVKLIQQVLQTLKLTHTQPLNC
jgi:hypothetical protein